MAPDPQETQQNDNQSPVTQPQQPDDAGQAALGGATIGDTQAGDALRGFGEQLRRRQAAANLPPDLNQSQQSMEQAHKAAVATKAEHLRNIGQNALRAAGTMLSHLGDVGAIGKVPEGGGALTGIGKTMAARTERTQEEQKMQQEQQKNSALIAETNARTRHTQAMLHRMDDEDRDKLISDNQAVLQMLDEAGVEYKVKQHDSDQITQGLKDGKINPAQQGAILDGKKDAGTDSNGNPLTRGTYSIVVPKDVVLDENNPKQKKVLDWLNQNAPPAPGQQWQSGQRLTGEQFLHYVSIANQAESLGAARKKWLSQNKIDDYKQGEELESYQSRDTITQALTAHNMDYGAAYTALAGQKNPDGSAKYPNASQDMAKAVGENEWRDYLKSKQKLLTSNLDDIEKKLDNVSSTNEIAGQVANLQARLVDPTTLPEQKNRTISLLGRATAMKAAMEKEEQDKFNAEQRAKDGDADTAGRQLANHELTLSELKTRGVSAKFIEDVQDAAKKYDSTYSSAVSEQQAKIAGNETNTVFFGNVQSLIGRGGTLDQLAINSGKISDSDWKILNRVKNWSSEELGKAGISGYAATAVGVADDYAKVMGGSVGSDTSRAMVLGIIDPSKSPSAKQAAVNSMTDSVRSQAEGRMGDNPFMRRAYGPMLGMTGTPNRQTPNLPPGVISRLQQTPGKPVNFGPKGYWAWVNGRAIQTNADGRPIGQ